MPDTLEVIKQRRSIRKYLSRPVSKELIEEVLAAAGWAPSAHNAQPWRFIVLCDPKVKRKLAEDMAETWASEMEKDGSKIELEKFKSRVERFATAPVLVLACLIMEGMEKFSDEKRQRCERDLAMQSLAVALQNMLLAAYAKGLGACWYCAPAFCKETVKEVLEIPAEIEPQALIAMGYPAEEPTAPPRKLIGEYCFRDRWGEKF